MITVRSLLTGIALVALSAVALAAAWQVMRHGLNASALGEPEAIFTWLADNDVQPVARETQLKLVRRLELQLRSGADPRARLAALAPQQREQFRQNIGALTSIWLRSKVDGYFAQPEDEREEYIDRELATILRWPALVRQASDIGSAELGTGSSGLVDQLIELAPLMEQLIQQSGPEDQRRIQEFVVAVQNRAAAQSIFGGRRRRLD